MLIILSSAVHASLERKSTVLSITGWVFRYIGRGERE
jgi:hypothetical protein